jgi:16S rRNA (uracil1498-N3)-methyltransferase
MPVPRVTLIQALAKPARMDWLVEKATELGVGEILPVTTERVVVEGGQHKVERWERIAASAARQCGTPHVPRILPVCSLSLALERIAGFDLTVLGCLAPGVRRFREAMEMRRGSEVRNVALLIGPEGDFTPGETSAMLEKGAVPVSFGPLVLRVETAAVFGLSVLLYELSTA